MINITYYDKDYDKIIYTFYDKISSERYILCCIPFSHLNKGENKYYFFLRIYKNIYSKEI